MTSDARSSGSRPSRVRGWAPELVAAVAFVVLLVGVWIANGPVWPDAEVVDALPPRSGADSVHVVSVIARVITDAGDPDSWTVASLVLAVVVGLAVRSWMPLRLVAVPVLLSAGLVLGLKAAVGRIGPPGEDLPGILGYFPSGHTATAFVCTGALAALLARWRPDWGRALRVAVVAWTVVLAAALVYYRYHWLTDTLGSLLLGFLVLRLTCRSFWGPAGVRPADVRRTGSGDDPAPQEHPLRLREDA